MLLKFTKIGFPIKPQISREKNPTFKGQIFPDNEFYIYAVEGYDLINLRVKINRV